MEYLIKKYVDQGFDFSTLYPEKQEQIRQTTGYDFDLPSIVKFLQKQTNNFTIDNSIAHDLDQAIYKIIEKQMKGSMPESMPMAQPMAEPMRELTEEEKRQEYKEAVEGLEMLIMMGEELDEEAKEKLEIYKILLEEEPA